MAATRNLAENSPAKALEISGGYFLVRASDIQKMMRNAATRIEGCLGGTDIESRVDLDRVATDDLSAKLAGKSKREVALAGARRTSDSDQQM